MQGWALNLEAVLQIRGKCGERQVKDCAFAHYMAAAPVVTLDMTLTSAACPLTDVIEDQAHAALTGGPRPLASDVKINWVWLPPWGPEKITDDGREQLRALGFNV